MQHIIYQYYVLVLYAEGDVGIRRYLYIVGSEGSDLYSMPASWMYASTNRSQSAIALMSILPC